MSALTLIILLGVGCAFAAVIVWRIARRVRRVVLLGRRRLLEVRTRFLPPGARRDTAVLRQRLAQELRSTRETLAQPDGRIFQADAATVLAEITAASSALDAALARVERFPSAAQQRVALATLAPQVNQLIETSYTARHTMLRTMAADHDRQLTALSETIAHEAAALATYEKGERDYFAV